MRAAIAALALISLATAALSQPTVFWASDPVQPDETVIVCGDGFTDAPTVTMARLADDDPGAPGAEPAWPGGGVEVEALQAGDRSVKFVVPAEMQPGASPGGES